MIKKISSRIWKFSYPFTSSSNVYLFKSEDHFILIDSGDNSIKEQLKKEIEKITSLSNIDTILLTHLHYDHIGNLDLFNHAKIYASKKEIDSYNKSPDSTINGFEVKGYDIIKEKNLKINELPSEIHGIKVIDVPGHTVGCVSFYLEKDLVLFSGDHIFDKDFKIIGRSDFKNSEPNSYSESLNKIKKLNYKILCPGHDYI